MRRETGAVGGITCGAITIPRTGSGAIAGGEAKGAVTDTTRCELPASSRMNATEVTNRSLGAFASIVVIARSTRSGKSGRRPRTGGGAFATTINGSATGLVASNGYRRVSSSYTVTPSAYRSDAGPGVLPLNCSGDMYGSVPARFGNVFCAVAPAPVTETGLASPKSVSATRPPGSTRMFPGFRSRCTTP